MSVPRRGTDKINNNLYNELGYTCKCPVGRTDRISEIRYHALEYTCKCPVEAWNKSKNNI